MADVLTSINEYYTEKIKQYGSTPSGVDWNSEDSQLLRFRTLCKLIRSGNNFSLNDLGCGYGRLAEYIASIYPGKVKYFGYDLSEDMIMAAKAIYVEHTNIFFSVIIDPSEIRCSDYTVASGIFNVKMMYPESEWLAYILKTIDMMHQRSKLGYSFNILTKYSDQEYMKNNLFYADPCFFFDYCKRNHSRNVSLIHDYDLYEFTILVKK